MASTFRVSDVTTWGPAFARIDPNFILDDLTFAFVFGEEGQNTIVVTRTGEVLTAGWNYNGVLGVGDDSKRKQRTSVVGLSGWEVSDIRAGRDHVMVKTTDRRLLVWGANQYYQLGNGSRKALHMPQPCRGLDEHKVKRIACGRNFCLVLTDIGKLFAWGNNDRGQIGCGSAIYHQPEPVLVQALPATCPVKTIGCMTYSSFAMTAGGELYGWGCNSDGELGIGHTESQRTPLRIPAPKFRSIVCGNTHMLAITVDSKLLAWGQNSNGQVGVGSSENVLVPTHIDINGLRVEEAAASIFSHLSAARISCGKVFAWGRCGGDSVLTPQLTSLTSLHEAFVLLSNPTVTYQPLTSEEEDDGEDEEDAIVGILEQLRLNFNNEAVSSVCFLVEGRAIHGHRSFLRMQSSYLRTLLSSDWSEDQREVKVEGHGYKAFYCFIKFLYTGRLEVSAEDAVAVLQLADEYCESALKRRCEKFMRSIISVDNVLTMYDVAKKLSADGLERFCLRFASDHLIEMTLSDSYRDLDPQVCQAFFRMVSEFKASCG